MTEQPEAGASRAHNCQTPDCPNDYVVITVDVESSETMFHCRGCWLAFALAVAEAMHGAGLLGTEEPLTAPPGAQVTT